MTTTIPAGHPLEGKADLIIGAGEQVTAATAGIDDRARRLGRCAGECARTGLVWRHVAGASLSTVRCPVCDGRLRQTTNSFRARFYRLTEAYVRLCAAQAKAADKARTDELLKAGVVKRVVELEPGDVIIAGGTTGRVARVLGAGAGPTGIKARVAVEVELSVADVIRNGASFTHRILELPGKGVVNVTDATANGAGEPRRYGAEHPGEVLLDLARFQANRLRRHAANTRTLRSAWAQRKAAEHEAEADEYAVIVELLERAELVEAQA